MCSSIKFNTTSKSAFTALELIIVVVIISILTTLVLPGFQKTIKRSREKLAISNLRIIASAQKLYRVRYGSYTDCSDSDAINEDLTLDIESKYFDYSVEINGNNFTAYAEKDGVTQCTIDQEGNASCP
ncbi:MAG: prepilin-type N-terminal cleavage/methylation domain-containing protein [Candidatus Saelkia tenebricola]|nr:prepilin-type N-terminal cleavage/methylation domain-containing protein [Candidatus Saelkia tenebricola]